MNDMSNRVLFCGSHTREEITGATVANGLAVVNGVEHGEGTFFVASDTAALYLFWNGVIRLVADATTADVTKIYVDQKVQELRYAMAGGVHYKGTVEALPDFVAKYENDVGRLECPYAVGDIVDYIKLRDGIMDGLNYICTSVSYVDAQSDAAKGWNLTWDCLSGDDALEGYVQQGELTNALARKQDMLTAAQIAAVDSGVTSAVVASVAGKQDALTAAQIATLSSGMTSDDKDKIGAIHFSGVYLNPSNNLVCGTSSDVVETVDAIRNGCIAVFVRLNPSYDRAYAPCGFRMSSSGHKVEMWFLFKNWLYTFELNADGTITSNARQYLLARGTEPGYGVCSTGASVPTKMVSVQDFVLRTGAHLTVTFNNSNTFAIPALKVNEGDEHPILFNGDAVGNYLKAGTYDLVYDGSNWLVVGGISAVFWEK